MAMTPRTRSELVPAPARTAGMVKTPGADDAADHEGGGRGQAQGPGPLGGRRRRRRASDRAGSFVSAIAIRLTCSLEPLRASRLSNTSSYDPPGSSQGRRSRSPDRGR